VKLVEHFQYGLNSPICLTWELTYACNLACVHCLSSSGRRDPRELSTAEAKGPDFWESGSSFRPTASNWTAGVPHS
jgi:MoaA/NifB/PqqE/SkfB family radical SAM enzyme